MTWLPAQDAAEQGGVETLWRGEAALHLRDGHLVLGRGGQEGQATGDRAEVVGGGVGEGAAPHPRGDTHLCFYPIYAAQNRLR